APRPSGLPGGGAAPARSAIERRARGEGGLGGGGLRAVRAGRDLAGCDQGLPGVRLAELEAAVSALRAAPGRRELRPEGLPEDGGGELAARLPGEDELSLDGVGPGLRERERGRPLA